MYFELRLLLASFEFKKETFKCSKIHLFCIFFKIDKSAKVKSINFNPVSPCGAYSV